MLQYRVCLVVLMVKQFILVCITIVVVIIIIIVYLLLLLFIDTEGSFVVERISQIAKAAVTHIQCVSRSSNDSGNVIMVSSPCIMALCLVDMIEKSTQYTMEYILGRIHYYRCHTYLQLIALTNILHTFISEHSSVSLLVYSC